MDKTGDIQMSDKKEGNMRIVFIHIPRTGGNMIKSLFSLETLIWSHNLRSENYKFFCRGKDDFVFTFVRDPLSRFLSSFYYLRRGGRKDSDNWDGYFSGVRTMNVVDFARERLADISKWQIHFLPQITWLKNLNHLDFVGRYEKMEEDYPKLCHKTGFSKKSLVYKPTKKDITDKEIEAIIPFIKDVYGEDYKFIEDINGRKD